MDQPKRRFFQRTVQAFSLYAVVGFVLFNAQPTREIQIAPSLLATLIPASLFFLALQLVLYLRTGMAWLLLRHTVETLSKVIFLVLILAVIVRAMVTNGWLASSLGGLLLAIVGTLVSFVLFSWGMEALTGRLMGSHTAEETRQHVDTLGKLDQLPLWRIAFLLIPRLKGSRPEASS